MTFRLSLWFKLIYFGVFSLLFSASLRSEPLKVKVVVVVTFEIGKDTGDQPGEFQYWAEREKWTHQITVPGVDHPVYADDNGVIAVVSGTTVRAGNQIMALVLSGMFDFSKTYWLFNGIGGVNPAVCSIGSAAWAHYVIDGDVAYELDPRDGNPAWPYGIMAVGSKEPNTIPKREGWEPDSMAYKLNAGLVDWAFALSKDTVIPDTDAMKALRAQYVGFPNAQKPPSVLEGDAIGSCRYWHGKVMTQWATDWVKLWTGGKGVLAMTAMEEQGVAAALQRLSKMDKVDFQRFLVLRTGSNYCTPPPQMDANKSMHSDYAGYKPSLEAAYGAGSKVLHALMADWPKYEAKTPSP